MAVKTTRITIETESLLVVHRGKAIVARCLICCADVEAMTLEGDILGEGFIPSTLLSDWQTAGKLHFWSPDGGPTRICVTSLLGCFESEDVDRLPNPRPAVSKAGEGK